MRVRALHLPFGGSRERRFLNFVKQGISDCHGFLRRIHRHLFRARNSLAITVQLLRLMQRRTAKTNPTSPAIPISIGSAPQSDYAINHYG